MSNDGLSNDEKLNILFKNYMNFASTKNNFKFYEETSLSNNTNIFSDNILSDIPPKNPNYINVDSVTKLNSYLIFSGLSDISINDVWFNDKISDGGSFGVNSEDDADRTALRLSLIHI